MDEQDKNDHSAELIGPTIPDVDGTEPRLGRGLPSFEEQIAASLEYQKRDRVEQPDSVTRFEVIDDSGRAYVRNPAVIELHYQDGGRTLKVFTGSRVGRASVSANSGIARPMSPAQKADPQSSPPVLKETP